MRLNVGKQDRIVRSIHCITLDCYNVHSHMHTHADIHPHSHAHAQTHTNAAHMIGTNLLMVCMHFVSYYICLLFCVRLCVCDRERA